MPKGVMSFEANGLDEAFAGDLEPLDGCLLDPKLREVHVVGFFHPDGIVNGPGPGLPGVGFPDFLFTFFPEGILP